MSFHVQYPRLLPERRRPGHRPAAPRFTLRWADPVATIVSQYHGMQRLDRDQSWQAAFFDRVVASFAEDDGPAAHEIMRFEDDAGHVNAVVVSYWTDATRHARWSAQSSLSLWLDDDARLADEAGYWRETIAVPYDRHETIYSAPHYRIGLGRLPGTGIEHMTTNGYFGAARDRLPISAIDALESRDVDVPQAGMISSRGRRLFAQAPLNMTAIRSGQFWEAAGSEQLEDYTDNLEPKLARGMQHLAEHPRDNGTLSLRIMTNLAADGSTRRETSVLGYFFALDRLEAWAKSHETHLDIYRHAIAMNRLHGEKREVVTWHEVFIMPGGTGFEYINCHGSTGLLPYVPIFERAVVEKSA
jgi:aldoxime dehydratase